MSAGANMHKEVLTKEQIKLLPLVNSFSKDFGLVGGTAIALHIGHRFSIDFDLFTKDEFENSNIRKKILKFKKIERVLKDEIGQYTIIVDGVNLTFFQYPFKIKFSKKFHDTPNLPDLLTLAAMKDYHSMTTIVKKTKQIFAHEFNEKIFRAQLAYFKDIDYSESVIYLKGFETKNAVIQKALIRHSLS